VVFAYGRPQGDDRRGPGLHLDVLDGRLSAIEIVSFDEMVDPSAFDMFRLRKSSRLRKCTRGRSDRPGWDDGSYAFSAALHASLC